jgi:hypothetical protein
MLTSVINARLLRCPRLTRQESELAGLHRVPPAEVSAYRIFEGSRMVICGEVASIVSAEEEVSVTHEICSRTLS